MDMDAAKYGVLSLIIPGLGHYLRGDTPKAVKLFAVAVALHIFIWFFMNNPLGSLVQTLYHIYSGWDAYMNY